MNRHQNSEQGNVLIYILLAVALIAALSYTVSRGQRGGVSSVTDQQAKLAAQDIIEYGNTLAAAVQKLRLRGCTDTQISFENSILTTYTNPNAPTDKSCDVFDIAGGGLTFREAATFGAERAGFPFDACVSGVGTGSLGTACQSDGTNDTDLIFGLDEIALQTCQNINELLGINGIPVDAGQTPNLLFEFVGTYAEGVSITNGSTLDVMPNAGCVVPASLPANRYHFYNVLLAR